MAITQRGNLSLPSNWRSLSTEPGSDAVADSLLVGGGIASIFGATASAIGGFFDAESQRQQLKSQQLTMEFESYVSAINARAAERDAVAILDAGRQEVQFSDLRAAAAKAADKTSAASRGVAVGVGSAAEIAASTEIARRIDRATIKLNAVRDANAARTRGINARIAGQMAGVSARNLGSSAGSIRPWASGASNLAGGAQTLLSVLAEDRRYRSYYRR